MTDLTAEDEYTEQVRTELVIIASFVKRIEKSLSRVDKLSEDYNGQIKSKAVEAHEDDCGTDCVGK